jgi:hypothetical protein
MQKQNYHASLVVKATAKDAFKYINSVSKWWTTNLEGNAQKLNDEFTVRFDEMHVSTQKLIEVIADKKVVWLVTDSKLNFVKEKREWTNTKIVFEIEEMGSNTQIHFTHFGLVPEIECYTDCAKGWDYYIKGSLFKLVSEGKGTPELK